MMSVVLPAFAGAEGYGAASVGGRGGTVYHVTTLNPTGPGSINEATRAKGPRTVVFDVSGVIRGDVLINDSNLTIAGQTAPGAGITIEGRLISAYSNWDLPATDPARHMFHDLIVRDIRVRPPQPGGVNGDCIQLSDWDRVILDHVSVAWGNDENIDLSGSRDVTVQWSTIEESDKYYNPDSTVEGTHNYGMIVGYEGKDISIHHNLFAHQADRNPLSGAEPLDFANNVVYDFGIGMSFHPPRMNRSRPGERFQANIVGNYFADGPSAPKTGVSTYVSPAIDAKYARVYMQGNYFDWLNNGQGGYLELKDWKQPTWQDSSDVAVIEGITGANDPAGVSPTPYAVAFPITTQTAQQAYTSVLAHAGSWPRDVVAQRTVNETRSQTGSWGKHAPAEGLMYGLTPTTTPSDTDRDGMPDAWETAHGLNPNDAADRNRTVDASVNQKHAGYTYLEFYLNELADKVTGMDQLQDPGVRITPNGYPIQVGEGRTTGTYQVALLAAPTADVTVQIVTDSQLSVSSPSLRFTSSNWNVPQVVTVSAIDDTVVEGPHFGIISHAVTSADSRYNGLKAGAMKVAIRDNDVPGITVTPASGLVTSEAGRIASVTVAMESRPTANVTIGLSSSDPTEGTLSTSQVVFTPSNWDTPQTVTITGVNDNLVDGNIAYTVVTAPAVSTDPNYQGRDAADISITNLDGESARTIDDGAAGFSTVGNWIYSQSSAAGLYNQGDAYYNAAGTGADKARWTFTDLEPGTYQVMASWGAATNRATNAPFTLYDGSTSVGTVRVNQQLAPNDFAEGGTNWERLGEFTINGSTLAVELSDAANAYVIADAIRIQKVGAAPPGVQIVQSGNSTAVAEGGAADSYTVVLSSRPTANVTVTVAKNAQVNVAPATLTFTPDNWNQAQTVQVSAVDDTLVEGTHSATLTHSVTSSDTAYNGIAVSNVSVVISDNDSSTAARIMDDGDSGFSTVGSWTYQQNSAPGFYNQGDAYVNTSKTYGGRARWTFTNLEPGTYKVAASWGPAATYATNAPFTVYDSTTSLGTVRVNQELTPGDFTADGTKWKLLGSFTVTGTTLTVQLANDANAAVLADAIRIEKVNAAATTASAVPNDTALMTAAISSEPTTSRIGEDDIALLARNRLSHKQNYSPPAIAKALRSRMKAWEQMYTPDR